MFQEKLSLCPGFHIYLSIFLNSFFFISHLQLGTRSVSYNVFSVGHYINLLYDYCICVLMCAHREGGEDLVCMCDEVRMGLRCNVDLSSILFPRSLK